MSENKNVTVKLKRGGWEVEITCPPEQLQKAVESVLSTLVTSPAVSNPSILAEKPAPALNKTCRGLIVELWEQSWFSDARALSEVHEEISRRGYHYDRTAVSHSLADLVRESILSRQGNMRNYTYIQKKPPASPKAQNEQTSQAQTDRGGAKEN